MSITAAEPNLRPDFDRVVRQRHDHRSPERLMAHYVLERRLAERLRTSDSAARSTVYGEVYGELFRSLPDHPQNMPAPGMAEAYVSWQMQYIRRRLTPQSAFLEIGCGDAAVARSAAPDARIAYGLDVTDALIDHGSMPANFKFLRSTGTDVPLPDGSVDLAYSNQLMEHLHVDDARAQLQAVRRALKPGGSYVCVTPNRATGPHDVSVFFDYEAKGFHLKEYTYASLRRQFLDAGFRRVRFRVAARGHELPMPYWLGAAMERVLFALPDRVRGPLVQNKIAVMLFGLFVIGEA